MALETVSHISDLDAANPAFGDPISQGDNHLRNIKTALKTDLPNITGPVTATQAELNVLSGIASNGVLVRTGAGTGTTRSIQAGPGITVSNGDGVSGNPIISVAASAGLGDVTGPGSSTDNALTRFDSTTGKVIQDSAVTLDDTGGLSGVTSINGGQLAGLRNKIINGNFSINQQSVSGTVTLAAGAYGHDMWKAGASGCTYTFATSNNVTTLTISAGSLVQPIEGSLLQSGTHTLSWSGTAQGKIGAGSYSASGVTGSVTGGTNLSIEFNTGTLSLVRLEPGNVATPFEFLPTGLELSLCQRYFYRAKATVVAQAFATGYNISTTQAVFLMPFPVTMRAAPSVVGQTGTAADYDIQYLASSAVCSAVPTLSIATPWAGRIVATVASGLTAGQGSSLRAASTSAYIDWSARL